MVLSLAMVPLLIIPIAIDLSRRTETIFLAVDYLIWAIFAVEYALKLYLSPNRRLFVRRNIPDLIIVLVPFLRPLRILRSARLLRLLRLSRVLAFAADGLGEVRGVLRSRGLSYVLLVVVAVLLAGAGLVYEFERHIDGANIKSFPDALWWAATTVTTVGYGDRFPTSAAGRGTAVALMMTGIALFGVITATIAAYFVEQKSERSDDELVSRLEALTTKIEQLESKLAE